MSSSAGKKSVSVVKPPAPPPLNSDADRELKYLLEMAQTATFQAIQFYSAYRAKGGTTELPELNLDLTRDGGKHLLQNRTPAAAKPQAQTQAAPKLQAAAPAPRSIAAHLDPYSEAPAAAGPGPSSEALHAKKTAAPPAQPKTLPKPQPPPHQPKSKPAAPAPAPAPADPPQPSDSRKRKEREEGEPAAAAAPPPQKARPVNPPPEKEKKEKEQLTPIQAAKEKLRAALRDAIGPLLDENMFAGVFGDPVPLPGVCSRVAIKNLMVSTGTLPPGNKTELRVRIHLSSGGTGVLLVSTTYNSDSEDSRASGCKSAVVDLVRSLSLALLCDLGSARALLSSEGCIRLFKLSKPDAKAWEKALDWVRGLGASELLRVCKEAAAKKGKGDARENAARIEAHLATQLDNPTPEDAESETACQVCKSKGLGSLMLGCSTEVAKDTYCETFGHSFCLNSLLEVPEGDWFCSKCVKKK